MDYSVTVRSQVDIDTLNAWADEEERDATHQLNYLIRSLLQQHAKQQTRPARVAQRRGMRAQAA